MNEIIRRSQEHLAKCQEQIEQSHEIIAISRRWLTAYQESVNQEQRSLSIRDGRTCHFIASAKAW
jgi:hypothetical protein